MKFVILTGNGLRHKKFAKIMCEHFPVKHVVFEKKIIPSKLAKKEEKYFGDIDAWAPAAFTNCNMGMVNTERVEEILKAVEPDYLLVFGSSLLSPNILNIPIKGCINLHTGLTQFYRGVDSHLWAIIDERLDRIGATVHFIDGSIDGGQAISQRVLDNIELADDLDDVFLKNCQLGFRIMGTVVQFLPNAPRINIGKGKLYQNKDRTDEIVKEAERKLYKMLVERKQKQQ